jgi:glutamine amidotransferase
MLLGAEAMIVSDATKLHEYDKLILPGVGAFGDAMEHLKSTGMKDFILEFAKSGKPILGVCLGMQLLFDSSDEFGHHEGLGLMPGKIISFDKKKMDMENHKIPHVGWNKIFLQKENKLLEGLDNPYLYFVHSFHTITEDIYAIGKTHYGYEFVSAVQKDNIYGIQPHPEKSHDDGIKILKNFIEL